MRILEVIVVDAAITFYFIENWAKTKRSVQNF